MWNRLIQNRFFFPALFLLAVGIQFSGLLLEPGTIPSYRDSTHFYYPLFQFLHEQFLSGTVPLWNPYQNLGVPLAANPTTALFYPPTWILALPLPCWFLYNIYIVGHVILAGAGIGVCCLRWKQSRVAAFVAAVSYALGAIVLFQHTNLIYLVSSAWLPWTVWAAESALRFRSLRWSALAGGFVALTVLGGDVQGAYHWGIISGLLILTRLVSVVGRLKKKERIVKLGRILLAQLGVLAVAAVVAAILAAVQILPLLEWAKECNATGDTCSGSTAETLETSAAVRYQFSVPPWRLAELVWGNVGGRQFPEYRRWSDLITGNDSTCWSVSLYMGAVPFLLALTGWGIWRTGTRRRWLSIVLVWSLAASFGYFGLGYLIESSGYWFDGLSIINGEDWRYWGNMYGWLGTALPGYSQFRYPAKWLPLAALAVSLLAGISWDRVWTSSRFRRRLERFVLIAFAFGLSLAIIGFSAFRNVAFIDADGSCRFFHSLYGPFAGFEPVWLFVSVGSLFLAGRILAWNSAQSRDILAILVLVDLLYFNQWLVPTVPSGVLTSNPITANTDNSPSEYPSETPVRIYRTGKDWVPDSFRKTTSVRRESELAVWNRESLFALNSLPRQCATSRYNGTRMLRRYADWLSAGRRRRIAIDKSFCQKIVRLEGDCLIWSENPDCLPVAWLASDVQPVSTSLDEMYPADKLADLRKIAFLKESDIPAKIVDTDKTTVSEDGDSFVRITDFSCNQYTIQVSAKSPSVLVLAEQYYPGWIIWMGPNPAMNPQFRRVLCVDGTLQGFAIPQAGEYTIHFLFLPVTLLFGGTISLLGWFILSLFLGRRFSQTIVPFSATLNISR